MKGRHSTACSGSLGNSLWSSIYVNIPSPGCFFWQIWLKSNVPFCRWCPLYWWISSSVFFGIITWLVRYLCVGKKKKLVEVEKLINFRRVNFCCWVFSVKILLLLTFAANFGPTICTVCHRKKYFMLTIKYKYCSWNDLHDSAENNVLECVFCSF